jgi:glycosyltransferase involved in cell wall biosynthesis
MIPVKVNVFAQNSGWLFEDLKRHFRRLDVAGVTIVVSDLPCPDVDAWVALRTGEAYTAPELGRTAVCIHDLFDEPGLYAPDGGRRGVHGAGAFVLCHPLQRPLLEAAGVPLDRAAVLERPIGALSWFSPADRRGARFTIGWVGRKHWRKRLDWFVEAMTIFVRGRTDFDVVLVGWDLEEAAGDLGRLGIEVRCYPRERHPIEDYPGFYHQLDVLVITSLTEAGPLTLFEAMASGLAVVSTPVGWVPHFSERLPMAIRIAKTPGEIADRLGQVEAGRDDLFKERHRIADVVSAWSLEGWLHEVARLAAGLAASAAAPRPGKC